MENPSLPVQPGSGLIIHVTAFGESNGTGEAEAVSAIQYRHGQAHRSMPTSECEVCTVTQLA
jgi:hypothetical protein